MSSLAERLREGRKNKQFSQQKLAEIANVHYTNIGKYERGEATPSATVLNKIAKALDISPDYLINGTIDDKANVEIKDQELLLQFKRIDKMPEEKKHLLKEFLDAFIFKITVQQLSVQ
jgi:transcriptional regulator with XRE-family HTH domain